MKGRKVSAAEQLMREFPTSFHDGAKHLIVGAPSEEYFPGVQLKQGATDGPNVNGKVVGQSQD